MTDFRKAIASWNRLKYPVTIVADRYSGLYSRGKWLAFPCEPQDIPAEVFGEDSECADFWATYDKPVGKGNFPDDAFDELEFVMKLIEKGIGDNNEEIPSNSEE